ncbi:MAG: zraS 1 [Verrucomicrobiales bacterium]|nr:zraS 1 [Verrucomicrobiales bacterium]
MPPLLTTDTPQQSKPTKTCFIAYSRSRTGLEVFNTVSQTVTSAVFVPIWIDFYLHQIAPTVDLMLGEIARADCVIADLSDLEPAVFFEIGTAKTMGKPMFLIAERRLLESMPAFVTVFETMHYSKGDAELKNLEIRIADFLITYQTKPQNFQRSLIGPIKNPFYVDWNKLERTDAENLCRELLAQMGFQQSDWFKESDDVELIAELPKKDPDGFEYRELWFVAMGRNKPILDLLEKAQDEPDYFIHRIWRSGVNHKKIRELGQNPITLLFIITDDTPSQLFFRDLGDHFAASRRRMQPSGGIRIRTWDRNYLTSLVHQFPNLGYKYFSDEGRSASKFRKSPEELNLENVEITARLILSNRQLEEEKNLRIRAERDAVWKDISFSAAHKLGNPIFAIETSLDPLERRILEHRNEEAIGVMKVLRRSIEKAKDIVDQFKSLARSQEMTIQSVLVRKIIETSCQVLTGQEVAFSIDCPPAIQVLADPEHLAECFDELIRNAIRWFDKGEKKIQVKVFGPATVVPPTVDASVDYALIDFSDNGPGIPMDLKSRIFDAFYTTHDHGTGLGLALVRRMIEGQRGVIIETGQPGKGAEFQIYLPLAENQSKTI